MDLPASTDDASKFFSSHLITQDKAMEQRKAKPIADIVAEPAVGLPVVLEGLLREFEATGDPELITLYQQLQLYASEQQLSLRPPQF
jgi:hypothetical protein